jgi:hypothetical protein
MEGDEDGRTEKTGHAILERLTRNKLPVDLAAEGAQHRLCGKDLTAIDHGLSLRRCVPKDAIQHLGDIPTPVVYEDQVVASGNPM